MQARAWLKLCEQPSPFSKSVVLSSIRSPRLEVMIFQVLGVFFALLELHIIYS